MIDVLTHYIDDLGAGREPVLVVLAVVLTAILVVIVRDLLVWFEALVRDLKPSQDDSDHVIAELADVPASAPAPSFVERRNPASISTGFGRRRSDTVATAQPNLA